MLLCLGVSVMPEAGHPNLAQTFGLQKAPWMCPHSSGYHCPQQLAPRARPQPRQPPQSRLSHGLYQLGGELVITYSPKSLCY